LDQYGDFDAPVPVPDSEPAPDPGDL
jgi:hypothetical protein